MIFSWQRGKLICNMKYILNHIAQSPIYIAVSYEAGGVFQPANKYGVAHLAEHIMLTNNKSHRDFNICAQTEDRFLSFFTQILNPRNNSTENALLALHDTINNPKLSQKIFDNEKIAMKNELSNFSYDYPNTNEVILHDYLFTSRPRPECFEIISGNVDDPAKEVLLKDVKKYINTNIRNTYQIIITGDFDKKGILQLIDKYFPDNCHTTNSILINNASKKSYIIDKSKNQSIVENYYGIGWSTQCINPREIAALLVAFRSITNPKNQLYIKLRYKHNLIYYFSSDQSFACDRLNLSIHTSFYDSTSNEVTKMITSFLASDKMLYAAIESQLKIEKESILSLTDGSKTTYSNQFYYSKFNLTIESYIDQINTLSTNEIILIFKDKIKVQDATVIVS